MMVVALAAGQLRAHLRFGGGPRLAAQGSVLSVRVMEIKHVLKGAPAAAASARPDAMACLLHADCMSPPACRWHPQLRDLCLQAKPPVPVALCACLICTHSCAAHAAPVRSAQSCPSRGSSCLLVAGQVLMWLLHVANPTLLAGRQLQLRGTLGMQGKLFSSELREAAQDLEVTSCGSTATMQLEVFSF